MKKWISILAIAILLLGGGIYFSLRSDLFVNQFKEVITARMEKIFDKEISVGRIEGGFFGNIVLRDVEIGGELTAEKVTINYNLRDALFRKVKIIESIEKITLQKPYFLVSGSSRNLLFLKKDAFSGNGFRQTRKLASQISARIVIKEGELVLRTEPQKIVPFFKNISGYLDLRNPAQAGMHLSARSIDSEEDNFALLGKVNLEESLFDLQLMTREANLAYYLNFLFPRGKLALREGRLNLNLRLSKHSRFPALNGRGEIKNGILKIEGCPLSFRELNGVLAIKGKSILLKEVTALWGEYDFRGKGQFDFAQRGLNLTLQEKSSSYQLKVDLDWKEKSPRGYFALYGNGGAEKLRVNLTVEKELLRLSTSLAGNSLRANVSLREGEGILLPQFEVRRKEGGVIKGKAIFSNLGKDSADFALQTKLQGARVEGEVDCQGTLKKLTGGWGATLSGSRVLLGGREFGRISAELEYSSRKKEFKIFSKNYELTATVDLEDDPVLRGIVNLKGIFPPVSLKVKYEDKKWKIASAARGYRLRADLDMNEKPGFLDLELLFDDLDLSAFFDSPSEASPFTLLGQVAGGHLRGKVVSRSPLDDLHAQGNLEIISPGGEIEKAASDFSYKSRVITLNSLEVEGGKALGAENLEIKVADAGVFIENKGKMKISLPGFLEGELSLHLFIGPEEIKGKIELANGNFTYPPQIRASKTGEADPAVSYFPGIVYDYDYDLELEIGRDVRYYNRYVNLEIKKGGELHLQNRGRQWESLGQLESARGTIIYLGTEFEIMEANLEFKENRKGFLSGRAETRKGDTRIILNLEGELGSLKPNLSSDSLLSRREIVSLLRWGAEYEDLSSKDVEEALSWGIGKLVGGGIHSALVDPLEKKFRRYLNLSLFRIRTEVVERILENSQEPDSAEVSLGINLLGETRFALGKYLTEDLYLTYEMSLKSEREKELGMEQEMGLEYTLKNGEVIKYKVGPGENGEKEQRVEIEKRIKF